MHTCFISQSKSKMQTMISKSLIIFSILFNPKRHCKESPITQIISGTSGKNSISKEELCNTKILFHTSMLIINCDALHKYHSLV